MPTHLTGPLQSRLDAITANTRALVQPERLAVTDNAVADLITSSLADHLLPAGAPAPAFALTDAATNKLVRSSDLLALGPLILVFFRGRWDPYCMTTLEAWQQAFPEIRARGALLAAVSPHLPRQNAFAVEQHHFTFPLLSDPACALAAQFGIAYTVPEPLQRHFRSILVNLPFVNGDPSWQLPLPATILIDPRGLILHAEAYPDHRTRTDPATLLDRL
jgi:peroxiredoxin